MIPDHVNELKMSILSTGWTPSSQLVGFLPCEEEFVRVQELRKQFSVEAEYQQHLFNFLTGFLFLFLFCFLSLMYFVYLLAFSIMLLCNHVLT